jgi:cell wall-associated NlpC family hydrolase
VSDSRANNPSPPFRGERKGPAAKPWEGEVGAGNSAGTHPLTPTLSPTGGEGADRLPDPRLHAYRPDLADARLRGRVAAPRYAEGMEARAIVGRAKLRRSPFPTAALDTFCHYGETLLVFDEADGFLWCQSRFDRYVGYVEAAGVALGPSPPATHFVATPGSYAYDIPDLRAPPRDFLPRHAAVTVVETGLITRGTEYTRLDTGHHLPLACLSPEPPRSQDIAAAAALYLSCPYLWGGKSFLGIDCSGLVQNAFRDLGLAVLRDTDMQRDTIGTLIPAAAETDLRRNDLLYMPGHVLIYEGNGSVIHADGASMTVRREPLSGFMCPRGLAVAEFVVRRP